MKTDYQEVDLDPARKLLDKHLAHNIEYEVQVAGTQLIMLPNVFCPAYTNTSVFLGDNVRVSLGELVLDMFSGSGYQGIRVAKAARLVVAVDHSPTAVECIKRNARLHGLSRKMRVFLGDLFSPVQDQKFDVIIANPPLLPGVPESMLETAILDPDLGTTKRFLEQVRRFLRPNGRVYLLFSDVTKSDILGGVGFVRTHCQKNGLSMSVIAEKPVGYETYFVILLRSTEPDGRSNRRKQSGYI